jgi:dolichyl-phosphate beta-glucosyltransferase
MLKISGPVHLSVVIPAYNESGIIRETLNDLAEYFIKKPYLFEFIIVNDCSTDQTAELVKSLSAAKPFIRLINNQPNMGKGFSVKSGVLAARGDYILFKDADLSTPLVELEKMLPLLADGCDVAIGSRALAGSKLFVKQHWFRQSMGKAFNVFVKLLVFSGINDTQCGFKCFKKEAAQRIFSLQRISGFCFDVEILYIAKKLGFKIKEIPVSWSNRRDSRVRICRDPLKMFWDLFRIKINQLRGVYDEK